MNCAHTWPDELTPDAQCLTGCGLTYGDWSQEDNEPSHQAASLLPSTETKVPA